MASLGGTYPVIRSMEMANGMKHVGMQGGSNSRCVVSKTRLVVMRIPKIVVVKGCIWDARGGLMDGDMQWLFSLCDHGYEHRRGGRVAGCAQDHGERASITGRFGQKRNFEQW